MTTKQITAAELRTEVEKGQEKLRLIDALEALCPGFRVVLQTDGGADQSQNGHPEPRTLREKVSAVLRGKWATMEDIVKATGLHKDQIYGVLTAPDSKADFERKVLAGDPQGRKQYKLVEKHFVNPDDL